ncbi:hypothetical protein Y1Q_0015234 [Alligator mississippiensis]|uniref:Uncharacterized protein n=1 Tax=Alligator mississippiensis TaxID=8496 RepID=A0A151LZM4_ALLMI|nr:hypothetical protein Y1Q_0015234 [Alligator mississippiensis]
MVAAQGLAWQLLVWAALGLGGAAEPCEGQRRERVGAPEGGGSFVVAALACGLLLALAYGALQAVVKVDEDKDEDKEEEEEEGGEQALANVEHDLRAFLAELRRHQGRAPDQGRGAAGWDLDRLHVTVYELEPE